MLTYGLHCVWQTKSARDATDKLQAKLLKAALGLKVFSRSTPLLEALKIPKISSTIEIQQLVLFKTMLTSSSRTGYFYKTLIQEHLNGSTPGHRDLVSRVNDTCIKYGISLVKYLYDDSYANIMKRAMKHFPVNDGLVDSIRHLLAFYNPYTTNVLNLLLLPF